MPSNARRPLKQRLALKIAFHRLNSVFEICKELSESDRKALYETMCERALQHLQPPSSTKLPDLDDMIPARFSDRCRELAAHAPNYKIADALLTMAEVFDAKAEAA